MELSALLAFFAFLGHVQSLALYPTTYYVHHPGRGFASSFCPMDSYNLRSPVLTHCVGVRHGHSIFSRLLCFRKGELLRVLVADLCSTGPAPPP